jgi:hypothetical protein
MQDDSCADGRLDLVIAPDGRVDFLNVAAEELLRVRGTDLEIEGEMRLVTRLSDAGNLREGRFCPECGVRIVHGTKGAEMVNIKAGTLDDPTWLVPAGHIWVRSKQRFLAIRPDELSYETAPDDGLAALAARWKEMLAQS